jgi:hypothetical protein
VQKLQAMVKQIIQEQTLTLSLGAMIMVVTKLYVLRYGNFKTFVCFVELGKSGAGGVPRPKVAGDMFGDLLGNHGFDFNNTKKESGPKTINAMRKEELIKEMDPDKMKAILFVHL